MTDLSVQVAGVPFKNPIIPASGVFGYGHEYEELFKKADFCLYVAKENGDPGKSDSK